MSPPPGTLLLFGFSRGILGHLEGWAAPGSVVVLEEPDVCRKKRVDRLWTGYRSVREVVELPYQQCDAFLEPLLARHRAAPFAAVIPCVEYAVPAAAALAAAAGLPGASVPAAAALRDKLRLREVTTAAGMAAPDWQEVRDAAAVRTFAAAGPTVLKPANRQASVGVSFLDRPGQVAPAWHALVAADEPRQLPDRPLAWRYLVERRMAGPEYSVEALVAGGEVVFENVTAKSVLGGDAPVEDGHVVPAPLDAAGRGRFAVALRQLVAATGFGTGILHAEWIDTAGGLVLVECAGRIPGDQIIELIDLAYGIRLCHALADLLAGRPVELPREPSRAAAIRFLTASPGRVLDVNDADRVRAAPGVEELTVTVGPGDEVRRWRSSWDRIGYVLASGTTPDEAAGTARRAADAVRVETAPLLPARS